MAVPRLVHIDLVGAGIASGALSAESIPPASHFLSGVRQDFHMAHTVSGFERIGAFQHVYPGIHLAIYADDHHLEYAFLLETGADASRIRLKLDNVRFDNMTGDGTVIYQADGLEIYQHPPAIFRAHEDEPQRPVRGNTLLLGDTVSTVAMTERDSEFSIPLNETQFNVLPATSAKYGPEYDFYMSRYEITNEQFIQFLNNAEANRNNARGEHMFVDKQGNVWMHPDMQPQRDELFMITHGKILYDQNRVAGDRYYHIINDKGERPYAYHPAVGISWFGAVKYCNWLTLQAGRGLHQRAYYEGTNTLDWAPVTSTNWTNGFFTAGEREAWLQIQGFRLPMSRLFEPDEGHMTTNAFNEFDKAASWNGHTNVLYGYGRDTFSEKDAHTLESAVLLDVETLPVGYFNGFNLHMDGRTLYNENAFGIYDLTGNVGEWLNDPARAGTPEARSLAGGSYQERQRPVNELVIVPPYTSETSAGFRPVTTFMPESRTQINILFCFHSTNAIPESLRDRFGMTFATPTPPAAPTEAEAVPVTAPDETLIPEPEAPEIEIEVPGILYQEKPTTETEGIPPLPKPPGPPGVTIPDVTLTVQSENPDSGVVIRVTPSDLEGDASGNTTFDRTYEYGQTVTLTAPPNANGNPFLYWRWNNTIFSDQAVIDILLLSDLTITAVYGDPSEDPESTLTVRSRGPDGPISTLITATSDLHGDAAGTTSFNRTYDTGTQVTLNAPSESNGFNFTHWEIDGAVFSNNRFLSITLYEDMTVTAVYIEPSSSPSGL